jgi:hypothetical protein
MEQRLSKVGVPNSVIYLNRTPIFEMYVISCGFKNGYQQDMMCLNESHGLCAHNMITILGLIVNIIEGIFLTM